MSKCAVDRRESSVWGLEGDGAQGLYSNWVMGHKIKIEDHCSKDMINLERMLQEVLRWSIKCEAPFLYVIWETFK